MKKILVAAAAMLAMAACGSHNADKGTVDTIELQTGVLASVNEVEPLANDSVLRPGVAPEQPTVVDFNATWCGPCKQFAPVFHQVAERYPDVRFISADVDNLPLTAEAFGIRSIPTVVFISADGTAATYIGTGDLLPAEKFENLIKSHFGK